MEYLMTYGWAILIIAIVLGILYQLGVFTGSAFVSSGCTASPGFLCSGTVLNTGGLLSANIGWGTGTPITITGVGCSNSATVPTFSSVTQYTLQEGQVVSQDFQCPFTANMLGGSFSGYLWIEYNQGAETGLEVNIGRVTTTATIVGAGLQPAVPSTFLSGSNYGMAPAATVLSSPYSNLICAGAASNTGYSNAPGLGTNYTTDVEDSVYSATAIGRGTHTCEITATNSSFAAIAAIGLAGAPSPTPINVSAGATGCANTDGVLNYTITNPTSFVVIAYACSYLNGCSITLPSGCMQRQNVTDGEGDNAYIATCQSQTPGIYNISMAVSPPGPHRACLRPRPGLIGQFWPVSMAVYVYPNYDPSGS